MNSIASGARRSFWKNALWQTVAIFLIAAGLAALTRFFHPRSPAWYQVEDVTDARYRLTIEELKQRYPSNGQIFWIDARPADAFDKGHVEGAHPLTEEGWADQLWDLRETFEVLGDQAVVVYCDGKKCKRSADVARRLRELAIEPVWVLQGDWRDW